MKLVERELGPHHVSCDIGCHLFSILPPFNIGSATMGYGLGGAGAAAFNADAGKRAVAVVGDGGFWHNGVASSVGNAVFNKSDHVTIIVDNGYSAATGGQEIPSSRLFANPARSAGIPIEQAARGIGVGWIRLLADTYDLLRTRDTLKEALTTSEKGPKVIVAQSECMLNKQRRLRPLMQELARRGRRIVREQFGIDSEICTGDRACIRLSGCPALTIASNPDPLRREPVTRITDACVGCGLCGELARTAALCPSFYRISTIENPSAWERLKANWRARVIGWLQRRAARSAAAHA
jgi:indolepyruvate ferredoxin oxidoreductase alpha subunit